MHHGMFSNTLTSTHQMPVGTPVPGCDKHIVSRHYQMLRTTPLDTYKGRPSMISTL